MIVGTLCGVRGDLAPVTARLSHLCGLPRLRGRCGCALSLLDLAAHGRRQRGNRRPCAPLTTHRPYGGERAAPPGLGRRSGA